MSLLTPGASEAASVRVPSDFFGINFQHPYWMTPFERDAHVQAMAGAGIREVRLPVGWDMIEPQRPNADGPRYQWGRVDAEIKALAENGIRAQLMFAYAPGWASSATTAEQRSCRRHGAAGLAPGSPAAYAHAATALARRYGPGGEFWVSHGEVPRQPVRVYEVWNSPNHSGAWCPAVDPGGYAVMFVLAARGIGRVQENARVVVGGVGAGIRTENGSMATPRFLLRVVAARPAVTELASAVGIHAYPLKDRDRQLEWLPKLRTWLQEAGFPNSTPMLLNEIGFSRAGAIDYSETERVEAYVNVMSRLPRTNCNLSGVLPYAWVTSELDRDDAEHWFGISRPRTGSLYPSGEAFIHWAARFQGLLAREAPTETIALCDRMPRPDQDRDGVPDEEDYWPLDASRPKNAGGGEGRDAGGGRDRLRCTLRGSGAGDVLTGTPRSDVICAGGGADVVRGVGGGDVVWGGPGSDLIRGGRGGDVLFGGAGMDALSGGPGRDVLHGGPGRDRIRGGKGG